MDSPEITATFGPARGDPSTLSKASRKTLHVLYRHPIAHNPESADVVSLREALDYVDQRSHDEMAFSVGDAHHAIRTPHSKDLTSAEIMEFRHILSQAGWAPRAPVESTPSANTSGPEATANTAPPDLLVVAEHHQARLYRLNVRGTDPLQHVITPYDPIISFTTSRTRTCPASVARGRPRVRVSSSDLPRRLRGPGRSS